MSYALISTKIFLPNRVFCFLTTPVTFLDNKFVINIRHKSKHIRAQKLEFFPVL